MQKLIKLSDTHYIVVDDSEIKEGDCRFHLFEKTINLPHYRLEHGEKWATNNWRKITHSTEPLEEDVVIIGSIPKITLRFLKIKKLSLSDVEEVINGYSVEKMALEEIQEIAKKQFLSLGTIASIGEGYILGFNAHKELVRGKLSVNQVVDFYNWLKKSYGSVKPLEEAQIVHRTTPDKIIEMYLQTLKEQNEWNCKVVDGKIELI